MWRNNNIEDGGRADGVEPHGKGQFAQIQLSHSRGTRVGGILDSCSVFLGCRMQYNTYYMEVSWGYGDGLAFYEGYHYAFAGPTMVSLRRKG